MAAGIALELYKVTRKMTLLFGFQTEIIIILLSDYTLLRTLYVQSKSTVC